MAECVNPPGNPFLCAKLKETDEAIQFLQTLTAKTKSDSATTSKEPFWAENAQQLQKEITASQMWHGEPPPTDWSSIMGIAAIVLILCVLAFWRRLIRAADMAFISSLAGGIRGFRAVRNVAARTKARAMEKADQP